MALLPWLTIIIEYEYGQSGIVDGILSALIYVPMYIGTCKSSQTRPSRKICIFYLGKVI